MDGKRSGSATKFIFRDLAIATQNFKDANLIGEGGFGKVFKGRLDSGQASYYYYYVLSRSPFLLDFD